MRHFAVQYDANNDAYKVLGVSDSDDPKKIKIAYYKLAQKYHPDKQGSSSDPKKAEEKFKAISHAYEMIKDEDAKKKYDKAKDEFKNPKQQQAS